MTNETEEREKLIRQLRTEHQYLTDGLKSVQQNLAVSVDNNEHTIGSFSQIKTEFTDLMDSSKKVKDLSVNLDEQSNKSLDRIKVLSESVEKIQSLLHLIEGISNQTNLLSLNATIEASRAGEEGKGFAVVAHEIKSLSNETKNSVRSITSVIKEIIRAEKEIKESFQATSDVSTEICSIVAEFEESLATTSMSSIDAMDTVLGTNDQIFMGLAKLDHIIWKVNTYISILAKSPSFSFTDHNNCRLGKWYLEGDGQKSFSHMLSYRDLEYPHTLVHNGTKKIFELLESGIHQMDELAEGIELMEQGSTKVFTILDKMLAEKNEGK